MIQLDATRVYGRGPDGVVNFRGRCVAWKHMTLGERVAWHRCRNGFTQLKLAIHSSTSQPAIGRLEQDVVEALRITTLRRIANALGVSCGELLD